MATTQAIQFSTEGMATYTDGSSWGTNNRMYPVGTWVAYTSSGGSYIGGYRQPSSTQGTAWGAGPPTWVTAYDLYAGIRVR